MSRSFKYCPELQPKWRTRRPRHLSWSNWVRDKYCDNMVMRCSPLSMIPCIFIASSLIGMHQKRIVPVDRRVHVSNS